jgi:hypothetical protein
MVYVAVVSAVIALSTAAATALFLRHVGIGGEPEQPPQREAEAPPMTLAGHPVPTAE